MRPILIAATAPGGSRYEPRPLGPSLWAGQGATHLTAGGLQKLLKRHTTKRFGFAISAHLFRDCVATTLANEDPTHARYAAILLGHHGLRTTERHYIAVNSEVALDRHHTMMASMRKLARQRSPKKAEIAQ